MVYNRTIARNISTAGATGMLAPRSMALAFAALVTMAAFSMPCAADIWGYVDDQGVSHLSDHQVNERYFLFKKEAPRPKAEAFDYSAINPAYTANVHSANPILRAQYAPLIARVAQEHNLDPSLLHAIITVESGYNPQAKSPAGAIGLMQLMPATAERYGVRNIWDPLENLQGGARYLRFLLKLFPDKLDLAIAAYNAGEGAVQQAGMKVPPYAETKAYVPAVITHYERYRTALVNSGAAVTPAGTVATPAKAPLLIR